MRLFFRFIQFRSRSRSYFAQTGTAAA